MAFEELDKQKILRTVLVTLGALTLVGLGAGGVYLGVKNKPEWFGMNKDTAQTQADAAAELNKLIAEVSLIIELPSGETPTLATVSDVEKVKDQPFFKNAKVGDKVLVYQTAKKAYLYRPADKKIIEVGVVNIPEPTSGQQNEQQNITPVTPTAAKTPSPTTKPTSIPSPTPTPVPSQ